MSRERLTQAWQSPVQASACCRPHQLATVRGVVRTVRRVLRAGRRLQPALHVILQQTNSIAAVGKPLRCEPCLDELDEQPPAVGAVVHGGGDSPD